MVKPPVQSPVPVTGTLKSAGASANADLFHYAPAGTAQRQRQKWPEPLEWRLHRRTSAEKIADVGVSPCLLHSAPVGTRYRHF